MIQRHQIVEEARRHIGTRFRHQGRLAGVGLDCVGLLVVVARAFGLEVVDSRHYSLRPDPEELISTLRANACLVELKDPREAADGDIVVMQFLGPEWPQHVAMRTTFRGRPGMIHTYMDLRKVVEHGFDAQWADRVTHAFALREVA